MIARLAFLLILFSLGSAWAQTPTRAAQKVKPPETKIDAEDDDEAEYRVTLEEKESRFFITIYAEFSNFINQSGNLVGAAFEAMANYALLDDVALGLSLTQALNMEGGLSITYTGLRATTGYALMGRYVQREALLSVDGQTTFVSTSGQGALFAIDAGLNQLMFNGTTRIVPATGLSIGMRYDRNWSRWTISLTAAYGSLVMADTTATMITAGVGVIMRF